MLLEILGIASAALVSWTPSFPDLELSGPGAPTMNTWPLLNVLFIAVIVVSLPRRPLRVRRGKSLRVQF